RFLHYQISTFRPRNRASEIKKVVFRIHPLDQNVLHRDAGRAKVTRHPHSLQDAGRISRSSNRTWRAVKHRSMRGAAAAKVVPLDKACKATSLAGAHHMNFLIGVEH